MTAPAVTQPRLYITSRLGTVHLMHPQGTCRAGASARVRKFVTPLQALVYHLTPCDSCWTNAGEFERHIGRRSKA